MTVLTLFSVRWSKCRLFLYSVLSCIECFVSWTLGLNWRGGSRWLITYKLIIAQNLTLKFLFHHLVNDLDSWIKLVKLSSNSYYWLVCWPQNKSKAKVKKKIWRLKQNLIRQKQIFSVLLFLIVAYDQIDEFPYISNSQQEFISPEVPYKIFREYTPQNSKLWIHNIILRAPEK